MDDKKLPTNPNSKPADEKLGGANAAPVVPTETKNTPTASAKPADKKAPESKPEDKKVEPKKEEPKKAEKKLKEVEIVNKNVRKQLKLTDEQIYLVEELPGGAEVKVKQGENEFVVGKEALS